MYSREELLEFEYKNLLINFTINCVNPFEYADFESITLIRSILNDIYLTNFNKLSEIIRVVDFRYGESIASFSEFFENILRHVVRSDTSYEFYQCYVKYNLKHKMDAVIDKVDSEMQARIYTTVQTTYTVSQNPISIIQPIVYQTSPDQSVQYYSDQSYPLIQTPLPLQNNVIIQPSYDYQQLPLQHEYVQTNPFIQANAQVVPMPINSQFTQNYLWQPQQNSLPPSYSSVQPQAVYHSAPQQSTENYWGNNNSSLMFQANSANVQTYPGYQHQIYRR